MVVLSYRQQSMPSARPRYECHSTQTTINTIIVGMLDVPTKPAAVIIVNQPCPSLANSVAGATSVDLSRSYCFVQ